MFVICVLTLQGVSRLAEHQQADFRGRFLGELDFLVQPAADCIPNRCGDGWQLVSGGLLELPDGLGCAWSGWHCLILLWVGGVEDPPGRPAGWETRPGPRGQPGRLAQLGGTDPPQLPAQAGLFPLEQDRPGRIVGAISPQVPEEIQGRDRSD